MPLNFPVSHAAAMLIGALLVIEGLFLAYLIYRAIATEVSRPHFEPGEIIFQDYFGSGHSCKNRLFQFAGASKCLWLIVTNDRLVVTAWFPFTLFSWFYDLEHNAPFHAITKIQNRQWFGRRFSEIEYQRPNGKSSKLLLHARDMDAFHGRAPSAINSP